VDRDWIVPREEMIDVVLTAATDVHRTLGPGLLESAYRAALAFELDGRGVRHQEERQIQLICRGENLGNAFRADRIVDGQLLVELKCTRIVDEACFRQVRTYLTLMRLTTGLLLNFGRPLLRDGIRRITVPPRLPSLREDPLAAPRGSPRG
jgi:iron complex transport system substrate-binding protein